MAADKEVELKFLADADSLHALQQRPPLADLPRKARSMLRTRYFDTPDHRLKAQGIFLRIRQSDGDLRQSVKEASGIARSEWEHEIADTTPDPGLVPDRHVAALLRKPKIAHKLEPVFETDVERTSLIRREKNSTVEISFDEGEIRSPGGHLGLHEIELELKAGDLADLFAFARELAAEAPLTLSLTSKGERGFLLAEGKWGKPQKVVLPQLRQGMAAGLAFKEIGLACLAAFLLDASLFEPATKETEFVHQARVAIRRLRAAMSFFKPIADDERTAAWRHEFKWISDLLGEARDLDVWQQGTFRPKAAERDAPAGFALLAHHMEARREQAYARLAAALTSQRLRSLLLEFAIWLQIENWAVGDRGMKIEDFLDLHLAGRMRKLVKCGRAIGDMDEAAQHRLRIAAKKLRYIAESFEPLAQNRKDFGRVVGGLEKMQSALGAIHDRVALAAYLGKEFNKIDVQNAPPQNVPAAFAAGFLAQTGCNKKELMAAAQKGYERFSSGGKFWS